MRRIPQSKILAFLAITILALTATGCSEDGDPAAPMPQQQAPALPDPALVSFDFAFFDQAQDIEASKSLDEYENFLNAYLRVALVDVVARLVMTPPVAAFSLALHTPPSLQDDGSWIWIYTHVDGDEELRIRLRGLPLDEGVAWELRVSAGELVDALWFDGTTMDEGRVGTWTFRDLEDPDRPESGRISWGRDATGRFLRFECLFGEDSGDGIEYVDAGDRHAITHVDASSGRTSLIEWYEDGRGSLTVPDYNGGERACWDTDLRDVDCR